MSTDSIASEVLQLLRESREYARYLGELGVETIPSAIGQGPQSATRNSASPIPAATKLRQEVQLRTRPALKSPVKQATPSRSVPREPTAPPASLFGDLSSFQTPLAKSSETEFKKMVEEALNAK